MKRILSIILSLILALALAGCGAESAAETTASETSEASAKTSEETNEEANKETAETIEETTAVVSYSTNIVIDADAEITSTVNGLDEDLCSWAKGGQDAGTLAGDDYAFAPVIYVNDNTFDSEKSLTDETIASDTLSDTSVIVNQEAVNGVIVNNSDYTIENSAIVINADSADGSTTCDFSGLGSALAVYGSSNVVVRNSVLAASGVADMGLFVDNGATVLLDGVTMSSLGGTVYSGYVNSPAQQTMVAPPWILGIMGNSRSSNLMGNSSTLTVMDSETSASNWAVLSTDSGSGMILNVVNSSLTLTGTDTQLQADGKFDTENPYTSRSGYGTYAIGNATETFIGVTMDVGTYATIFTGGSATYSNLVKGESYDLLAADGSTHTTYTATEDVQTVINSDTFGFMAHQSTNTCVLDGVQVNSEFTDFLVKSGNDTTITVKNGAKLNAGNGILLQLLDNDDSTTEFDSDTMAFGETHEEYAGFPTEAAAQGGSTSTGNSTSNTTVYNVIDTDLEGSLYNGIGWNANDLSSGNVKQMQLQVNLSGTSTLKGAIASTSCIHASYEGQTCLKANGITAFDDEEEANAFAEKYQVTSFGQDEYFNIGQVANLVKSNGLNNIDVTLSDSAVWTVTGTSLVNSVTLSGNAKVVVEAGVTLTVNGREYTEGTYTAADF